MTDDLDQTYVADSFAALYRPHPRGRLTIPLRELARRHDLCEDLAQSLVEPSNERLHAMGLAEDLILQRTLDALTPDAPCTPQPDAPTAAEAGWVVTRLAELLGWPLPAAADPPT